MSLDPADAARRRQVNHKPHDSRLTDRNRPIRPGWILGGPTAFARACFKALALAGVCLALAPLRSGDWGRVLNRVRNIATLATIIQLVNYLRQPTVTPTPLPPFPHAKDDACECCDPVAAAPSRLARTASVASTTSQGETTAPAPLVISQEPERTEILVYNMSHADLFLSYSKDLREHLARPGYSPPLLDHRNSNQD